MPMMQNVYDLAVIGARPAESSAPPPQCADPGALYQNATDSCIRLGEPARGWRHNIDEARARQSRLLAESYLEAGNMAMRSPRKDPTQRSLPIGIATVPDAKDSVFG